MIRKGACFVSSLLVLLLPTIGAAQTKGNVTFGGLKNLEFIQDYYNGGKGSLGSGPGKDLHLTFTSNAQAIVQAAKGGSGNFTNNPGNYPVMFFQTGNNVTMTAGNGITVGLWFYYSALQPGTATVYDGPNGTGNILASSTLTPNNTGCSGYAMCVWTPVVFPLSAKAASIRFGGTANYLAIGSIRLGQLLPTTTAVVSSQNPSLSGDPVTFTATVVSIGIVPAGTVTFKVKSQVVGQTDLVNGTASVTLSNLPLGTTRVTAKFTGTSFGNSQGHVDQVVNPGAGLGQ